MTRQLVDNVEITGTLKATGATDLDSTLNVDGVTTHVGDVIAAIIRKANETTTLVMMGGTSLTQGPYIALYGKDSGGTADGNLEFVSSTESSAQGDYTSYIYDGTTFNLFAAIRAASWRYELSAPGVAHGMTAAVPSNVYGAFYPISLTAGGLAVLGVSDIDARALLLAGFSGGATPTIAPILFYSAKKNGTATQALAAAEPAFSWQNFSTVLATILGDGKLGLGVAIPQGAIHAYDGVGSSIPLVTKTGIVGAAQTIIPDGVGDVTKAVKITGIAFNDVPQVVDVTAQIIPGGTDDSTIDGGTNMIRLAVSAGGVLTVIRQAGAATWSISISLIWQ